MRNQTKSNTRFSLRYTSTDEQFQCLEDLNDIYRLLPLSSVAAIKIRHSRQYGTAVEEIVGIRGATAPHN